VWSFLRAARPCIGSERAPRRIANALAKVFSRLVSHVKLSEVSGDKTFVGKALGIAQEMQRRAIPAPRGCVDDRRPDAAFRRMSRPFTARNGAATAGGLRAKPPAPPTGLAAAR